MGTKEFLKREQGQLQLTSKTERNMNRDQTTCLATTGNVIQRNILATQNMALDQDSLQATLKKDLANISLMALKNKMYNKENHQVVEKVSHQGPGHRTQGQGSHLARRDIILGQETLLV